MKKVLALTLALLLSASVAFAEGQAGGPSEGVGQCVEGQAGGPSLDCTAEGQAGGPSFVDSFLLYLDSLI
jgi:hypothetical protein